MWLPVFAMTPSLFYFLKSKKTECKPDKLAPGQDHLPRHNIWKIRVAKSESHKKLDSVVVAEVISTKYQVSLLACRMPTVHCPLDCGSRSDNAH